MSTKPFRFPRFNVRVALIAAFAFSVAGEAAAQQMNVTVQVLPDSNHVFIAGRCSPTSVWSFSDNYAGVIGLGTRIERFVVFDESSKKVPTSKSAPGQFTSAKPATNFQYEVSLTPPARSADSAMVSWLTKERGLLMLADLLPLVYLPANGANRATIQFKLPEAWAVYSDETKTQATAFDVANISQAIFAVGAHLRTSHLTEAGTIFSLVADGEWAFADRDALEMAGKVLRAHREVFGVMPAKQGTFILLPFPQPVGASQWAAETRGTTVTLLMGKLPSKIGALAQLSTPMTHEFFHLWVPNGLALEGDYDWFYEGFTIYEAARTAVRLDLLTFQEFLNAIAGAYDASKAPTDPLSLIEASRRRFSVGQTGVYSKSEVIAFIYDLRLRTASRGKRSLEDVYGKLFQARGLVAVAKGPRGDGNDAVMQALDDEMGSQQFARTFITSPVSINLAAELSGAGLKVENVGLRTRISVNEKLTKQQRDLLRQLGYNEITRLRPRTNEKN